MDNGWEVNFHTGIITETEKSNYETEISKISSKQLCLLYAQSFESFERFLKDCLFEKTNQYDDLKKYAISFLPKDQQQSLTRVKMPGGDRLFKILKKAGGESFKKLSPVNNIKIRFGELWTVLSEVRHAVTHNESIVNYKLIDKSDHHFKIFNYLFNSKSASEDYLLIELDYQKFEALIKRFAEFAFQVFKVLSIEEELKWKVSN